MVIIKDSELYIKRSPLGLKNRLILMIFSCKFLVIIRKIAEIILHLDLPPDCFKKKLRLGHPYNIIINQSAIIGNNVTIHQGVTIGSKQFGEKMGSPIIEDNVIIYPHSVILGHINIGKDSIIGAGSVVLHNLPPCSVVSGNPAKVIGKVILD